MWEIKEGVNKGKKKEIHFCLHAHHHEEEKLNVVEELHEFEYFNIVKRINKPKIID